MALPWWQVLSPLLLVMAGATLILLAALGKSPHKMLRFSGLCTLFLAAGLTIVQINIVQEVLGTYRWDPFTMVFTLLLLVSAAVPIVLSLHRPMAAEGEWVFLLLCAVVGGGIAIGASDLLTVFVGLELFSLSTYILVGLQGSSSFSRARAAEAAWKYLVAGGVASALFLYGISFVIGFLKETDFAELQKLALMASYAEFPVWLLLSFFLVFCGLAAKLAIVPLHLWAPDVYRASRSSILSWLLIGSKVVLIAVLLRIMTSVYLPVFLGLPDRAQFVPILLTTLILLTIVVGSVASLFQKSIKNAFAYASLVQGGYLLLPFVMSQSMSGVPSLIFPGSLGILGFLVAYALAATGGLAVIEVVTRAAQRESIASFAGLMRRSPWLALAMLGFLFSLAGLPLTAGFFAKWYLLLNVIGHLSYAVPFILATLFSYVAYFRIIRQMFFRPPAGEEPFLLSWNLSLTIAITLAGTLLLGLVPYVSVFNLVDPIALIESFVPRAAGSA